MMGILTSVKKMIGIDESYDAFDDQIVLFINSAFATLRQLGVGPENGYRIEDDTEDWDDYLGDTLMLESVKPYVALKVKLAFDPPTSSIVLDAMNRNISELEWRLNATAEYESN